MNFTVAASLLISAVAAATGMVLFRYGGRGNTQIIEFFNLSILAGCVCYFIGAVTGLYALSRVSAVHVYPFTVLQGVLIYLYSTVFLGERLSTGSLAGCVLVVIGLFLVIQSPG
jgi:drug/metabolite transporter (DMT)-like permease